ncbi:unnamed protein product [Diatraea saccharalis]|uniref:BEN domain-containing protein n=1 Tax=Diatraea saccharalis TaxID=40085 RepID=A0A9N9WGN0_9NEOP|nr:unnamed protein product [Diatraea saccharalis]
MSSNQNQQNSSRNSVPTAACIVSNVKSNDTGADCHTRLTRVQTATGEKWRASQRLYPLEVSTAEWTGAATDTGHGTPDTGNKDIQPDLNCVLRPIVLDRRSDESRETQMHIDNENKYAVIQFLELPYASIDDYVCVPHSWIRTRRAMDRKSTVAFPNEPWLLTKIRIKKHEKPLETWNVYMAIIKYETYSYIDAKVYIMGKKTVASPRNEYSGDIRYQISLPDAATNSINFSIKRIKLSDPQSKSNEEQTRVIGNVLTSDVTRTQGPEKNILYAPRNILILKDNILRNYPELDEDFSCLFRDRLKNKDHQDSSIQTMIVDEPTDASCNEQAAQSEQSSDNELFASINSQENISQSGQSVVMEEEKSATDQESSTEETDNEDLLIDRNSDDEADQPADSITTIRDHWRSQLADVFNEMHGDFSHACEVTLELHQSFVRSATAIKRMKNIYERFRNEGVKEVSVETPKDVTGGNKETTVEDKDQNNQAEVKRKDCLDEDTNENDGKIRDEKAKDSEDNNDDDGDEGNKNIEGDEEKETPKKIRGQIRTFVLPAEYDPKDTRWTLKHRENNPKLGLVELLPRTKVYINSIRLSHCKRVAKDSKTLARMLLVEIFSQTALSVCSLTGARANAFEVCGTKVRPGLDEQARMVILNFVEEHARQKNWGVFDTQSVINSIRSKIQEMRAKYGRTE